MTDAQQLLEGVRRRLDSPSAWLQGRSAADKFGFRRHPSDPLATCWCIGGAIQAESQQIADPNALKEALTCVRRAIGSAHVPSWNDHPRRSHAEVLGALDHAIKIAKARDGAA